MKSTLFTYSIILTVWITFLSCKSTYPTSTYTTCHCTCQFRGSLCGVYLKTHGEELAVLVARLEEADLVERLPLLVEKDVAALHLLVQNYGQRLSL
jgi:hypothetical protein